MPGVACETDDRPFVDGCACCRFMRNRCFSWTSPRAIYSEGLLCLPLSVVRRDLPLTLTVPVGALLRLGSHRPSSWPLPLPETLRGGRLPPRPLLIPPLTPLPSPSPFLPALPSFFFARVVMDADVAMAAALAAVAGVLAAILLRVAVNNSRQGKRTPKAA